MTPDNPSIEVIRATEWRPHLASLNHVFLVGDLQLPVPHPFFRRKELELIFCQYNAGDSGVPHWHGSVTEIEFVITGRIGYRDILRQELLWFSPGDIYVIPPSLCVERLVESQSTTLAIKVPSTSDKITCERCARTCADRRRAYSPK